ncbi:hypothetical protein BDV41DRAFT_568200 [Aspergillus transmontanensis]|uniref:Zn(2)-C6 fungal-type domain-containing protein n=1 Tax=Aspergillus transmontanensis TaxID=1034304 RepID=A0A5N6VJ81_9EURO|nr:hypothetical protein BDV41DRAFT_568200 [Aspergillus transmontanensis]
MEPTTIVAERPACDFCHSRKIKCDRQFPCVNCIDARVDCRRDRPKKSRRPKRSRHAVATGLPEKETTADDSGSTSHDRRQSESIERRSPNLLNSNAKDGLTQQTSEGTRFLQRELESCPSLGTNRSSVMREAIDFVSRLSDTSKPFFATDSFDTSAMRDDHELQGFPPELLYMMTMNTEPNTMQQSFWPDHVSFQTLEGMCLSLIEGIENQHTLTCYRVCVYMKAAALLCRLPKKDRSVPLRSRLEQSKKQYEHEVHKALSELDFLAPPSLVLLQALLSGALFMQNQGDMSRGWTLTAFASRTLVSLNYHTIDTILPFDGTKQDIYGALYSCYYLDKMLSVLLLRPPSLPKLRIKPADLVRLDPRLPLSASLKIMVEFAQVQEGVLDILLNHSDKKDQSAVIDKLLRDIYDIHTSIEKHQHQLPFSETTYEWVAIEFGYYALLTSVLHLNQRVAQNRSRQEDCLRASRQSLIRLRRMQDEICMEANFLDDYPYFLTWTLLFYPLNPFFVLFCNVVCSANLDDYVLMAAVTKGISRFGEKHPSIAQVHKLFSAFLGLVGPVIHSRPTPALSQPTSEISSMMAQYPPAIMHNSFDSNFAQESGANLQDRSIVGQDAQVSLDNELMWDLLDSQPWLGWIRSDALIDLPTSNLPF